MCLCITPKAYLQMPVFTAGTLPGCETHGGDHPKIGDLDPLDQGRITSLQLSEETHIS